MQNATTPEHEHGCIIYSRDGWSNEKFDITAKVIGFAFEQATQDEPFGPQQAIRDLIQAYSDGVGDKCWVSATLISPANVKHIPFPLVRKSALTNEMILNAIAGASQSDSALTTNQRFRLMVLTINDLAGQGRMRKNIELAAKRSYVSAQNKENVTLQPILDARGLDYGRTEQACIFFATVVCMARIRTGGIGNEWKRFKAQVGHEFLHAVADLIEEVGVDFSNGAGVDVLHRLEEVLAAQNYKLIVYEGLFEDTRTFGSEYVAGDENKEKIFLYYNRESKHYSAITNITGFFSMDYFCGICERVLHNKQHANCKGSLCALCKSYCRKEERDDRYEDTVICPRTCVHCNLTFRNKKCYDNHQKNTCGDRVVCNECACIYEEKRLNGGQHVCNTLYCATCRGYYPIPHLCFIPKCKENKTMEEKDKNTIYFSADFETRQDEEVEINGRKMYRHRANLVHAASFCSGCRDTEFDVDDAPCNKCGPREASFDNFDDDSVKVEKALLDHVTRVCTAKTLGDGSRIPNQQGTIVMHNSKAFDSQLILNHILNDGDYKVENVIMNGLLILLITLVHKTTKVKIKLVDFIMFAPAPLADLPKSFKIENVTKGYFPHYFNLKANYNYNSEKMPPLETFDPDNMPTAKRAKLISWYNQTQIRLTARKETYNFRDEIKKYCANDVYILRRAVTAFRSIFTPFNVDPFQECFTLASLANTVLLRNFYEDKVLGILPQSDSYRSSQSVEALKWLIWLRETLPGLIFAGIGKEQIICGAPVDGYDPATNTIYQFHGDFWHACIKCYKNLDSIKNPALKAEMALRRLRTDMRTKLLKRKNYNVVEMRECDWREMMAADPALHARLCEDPIVKVGYIRSRDAFFGGRTNATKLQYKCGPDEVIRLLDFKSLYPTINKWMQYPVKHPKVYTKDFPNLLEVNGLVLCKVNPPGNLEIPVLPEKIEDKLIFHLCSTCAREKKDPFCTHTDAQRSILGCWVSYELQLAIKMGYEVTDVYEVWDFEETRKYNPETGEDGLFNQYVDVWVKLKQVGFFEFISYHIL